MCCTATVLRYLTAPDAPLLSMKARSSFPVESLLVHCAYRRRVAITRNFYYTSCEFSSALEALSCYLALSISPSLRYVDALSRDDLIGNDPKRAL
eukprot:1281119-Pleurochrysis_carterae.AAC.4